MANAINKLDLQPFNIMRSITTKTVQRMGLFARWGLNNYQRLEYTLHRITREVNRRTRPHNSKQCYTVVVSLKRNTVISSSIRIRRHTHRQTPIFIPKHCGASARLSNKSMCQTTCLALREDD